MPEPLQSVQQLDFIPPQDVFPSPADWRDETLYFLLPDRFSDGPEQSRLLLDRRNLAAAPPATSGRNRAPSGGRAGRCEGFGPNSAT